jgi:hypothetical protein
MTPEQEHELTLLMAASQRGDRSAYEALLQGLSRVVTLYVRRRAGGADWVEDVVQDVLMSIHRARHTWNPERPFAPWFYAVMQSRLIDAIRRHKRTAAWEEPMDVTPPVVWSATPVALAAWCAWLAAELLVFAAGGEEVWPVAAGWGCIAKAFIVGLMPGLGLAIMVGRGAPVDARRTMVFAAMGAAAVGAFGVELTCPLTSPMHLLLWHAGPALAVVLVVASLGRDSFVVRAVFGGRR